MTNFNNANNNKVLSSVEKSYDAFKAIIGEITSESQGFQEKSENFQSVINDAFNKVETLGNDIYSPEGFNAVINEIIPDEVGIPKKETDVLYDNILTQMGLSSVVALTEREKKQFKTLVSESLINYLDADGTGEAETLSASEFMVATDTIKQPTVTTKQPTVTTGNNLSPEDFDALIS
jgi:hypothetical protein